MKRVLVVSLLVLAVLVGCSKPAAKPTPKIAVIDPQQVFNECDRCLEAGAYLKKLGKSMQDELQAAQKDMQSDPSDENKQKFQVKISEYQTKIQTEQQRVVSLLNDAFMDVLNEYRKAQGLEVVLPKEQVVSFDEGADITAAVVAALNARNVDLKLPADEAAGEAPKAEAAPEDAPKDGDQPAAEAAPKTDAQ